MVRALGVFATLLALPCAVQSAICEKPIYLTFDTGNMSVAEHVANILRKHQVKATFFLANERTFRQDYALDDSWKAYWSKLANDGHVFGSHTYFHTYWNKDLKEGVQVRSQFGPLANRLVAYQTQDLCADLNRVKTRFESLTGQTLSQFWRAPGGKHSPRYLAMGRECGYVHVGWSKAGFLGDELPSETYPNAMLLEQALSHLKPGDVAMAHLGIWSRKDPWATANLEALIVGLKNKGYCFDTLNTIHKHPVIY